MSNSHNNTQARHPLSETHFRQVIRRHHRDRCRMASIYGMTWNLRNRQLVPLGTASLMVMSYHPGDNQVRDTIELRCLTASVKPETGEIAYDQVRMSHDFMRNPFPGARERVLDPRDEGTQVSRGDRPNGSWVRLALAVDQRVCRAVASNFKLPMVPTLPRFYAGFTSMGEISMQITTALKDVISSVMNVAPEVVDAMTEEELQANAAACWPRLWRAPDTAGNDTGKWLIETRFLKDLMNAPHLYEDFSEMLGMCVWNPTREIISATVANPAVGCAKSLKIDLGKMLSTIARGNASEDPADVVAMATLAEQVEAAAAAAGCGGSDMREVTSYDDACEQFIELTTAIAESLKGYGDRITDEVLEAAVQNFEQPINLVITDPFTQLPEDVAIALVRKQLDDDRPMISQGTTDADILSALQYPERPLTASKLCDVQLLYRDVRMPVEEAFSFSSAALGRDRVSAALWAGPEWMPKRPQKSQPVKEVEVVNAAAEQPQFAAG